MEYYFNELGPFKFQRLINCILDKRYGDNFRITPLYGTDGGRDGETAPGNPYFEYQLSGINAPQGNVFSRPEKGRYLFQVKYHRTTDIPPGDARKAILADFRRELKTNVLSRTKDERVNYFFLITNVPSSKEAINKIDRVREQLMKDMRNLHADVWWKDKVAAFVDCMPMIWKSFPEIFAGSKVPFIADIAAQTNIGLSRSVKIALRKEYQRDSVVKFRQIDLETELSRLFIDLDVDIEHLKQPDQQYLIFTELYRQRKRHLPEHISTDETFYPEYTQRYLRHRPFISALGVLLLETNSDSQDRKNVAQKIVLEGGPGQGKSTITQMALQIYRQQLLHETAMDPEDRWSPPEKVRLPFRVELREFAEWLSQNPDSSVEQFLATILNKDSGSDQVSAEHIHDMVEGAPVFLVFDGLDEIGSDEWRDKVLIKIKDCIDTFEKDLNSDIRVVITTRPPAIVGRQEHLMDFTRLPIAILEPRRVQSYLQRWLSVHILDDEEERVRVRKAFENRQKEPHVQALVKNPMQLSVLLHFIKLKDEAFPDNRAKLYKEYFQIVIDRDVTKSPELRNSRDLVEGLHEFIGYKIHALTEAQQADGTLERQYLLQLVQKWLSDRGDDGKRAKELFRLGEDRLGLIVTARGEGQEGRYGYEIQPIREYFAAAFINNQINGDASEVFKAMIHRPYWKEVTFFLAGLRRPNEKADLIARTKYSDEMDDLGWRQDGRAVVLQLLQEGVFSERPDVFSMALDSILDLLDPKLVRVQNEPENLVNALCDLMSTFTDLTREKYAKKLIKLLQQYKAEQDEYVIYRMFRVASSVLEPAKIRDELMSHTSHSSQLTAKLRLLWPCSWEIDIYEAAKNKTFWSEISEPDRAYWWWTAANRSEKASRIPAPSSLHQRLLWHLATNPISRYSERWHPIHQPAMKPSSNWAVWKLTSYQQVLYLVPQVPKPITGKLRDWVLAENESVIDFAGLDHTSKTVVSDFISLYRNLLNTMVVNPGKLEDFFADSVPVVREHLQKRGILGWLACHCGMSLLLFTRQIVMEGRISQSKQIEQNIHVRSLYEDLESFYEDESHNDWEDYDIRRIFHRKIFRISPVLIPDYIRLEDKGELTSIVDLIANKIYKDKRVPFDLMQSMAFTTRIIRPLIDKCSNYLPKLLKTLGHMRFILTGTGKPILARNMNQILKIARHTEDNDVLRGSIIALSTSKFIRSSGADLILKLLRADMVSLSFITGLLTMREDVEGEIDSKEVKIVGDVARRILKDSQMYCFRTVCEAAKYLAENSRVDLPPLITQEDALQLHI